MTTVTATCELAVHVKGWGRIQCWREAVLTFPRPVCQKHLDEMRLRARLEEATR